jgi:hypothetical protein
MSAGGRIIFGICAFDAVMRRKKYNFFDGMHETVQFCPYILMDIGRAARFWLFPCCPSEKRGRYFLKKTQNYQLNQWDATDRILREDFNADNAKIDAATCGSAQKPRRLFQAERIHHRRRRQVNLDVSDIDFSKCGRICYVLISFHLVGSTAGYSYGMVFGTPDGYLRPFSLNLLRLNLEIENANCACDSFCTFLYNEQSSVSACTRHTKCLSSVLKWNEVREMDLYSAQGGYPINAGAKIQIRGVRR